MRPEDRHQVEDIPDSGLADSGLRHVFASGGMREMAPGKGRFDLLSPLADEALAQHMERGAIKYDDRNWEKGLALSSFIDSARRHLNQLLLGDETEPHAVAALWNLHCLVHTQEAIRLGILSEDLDDLPKYLQGVVDEQLDLTPKVEFAPMPNEQYLPARWDPDQYGPTEKHLRTKYDQDQPGPTD